MINIDTITKACTNYQDIHILKTIGELLEKYGTVYVSGKYNERGKDEIHNILNHLNESNYDIYKDTNDDMEDAAFIYFNSDNIWKRNLIKKNKMKDLLGNKYSSNHVLNFLNYWISPSSQELDKLWIDLNPDTIFSVWMPLKMCLQCSEEYPYKMQGNQCYPFKKDGYIGKQGAIINFLSDIKNNIEIYLPHNKWPELYSFAELAEKRANFMSLPNAEMQSRGKDFYDQMPPTLYNCFRGGCYYKYFGNDSEVIDWISKQKLEMCFKKKNITKDLILPLIDGMKSDESRWLITEKDIKKMLNRYIKILEERSKLI